MKLIIKYSRKRAAAYLSHLDMQRTFARALRRANIDVVYSQGFNPHIVMSFASPLSVGFETEADYIEVGVNEGVDPKAAKDALNNVFTGDIRVLAAFYPQKTEKKLMSLNHSAQYSINFAFKNKSDYDKIKAAVQRINSEAFVTKDRKGREVDVSALVLESHCEGDTVFATLVNSSSAALNPKVLAGALLECAGLKAAFSICRKECFAMLNGTVTPMLEL